MPQKKKRPLPVAGTTYSRKRKGTVYHMTVVKTGSGIGYKTGRAVFKSPTAAARSITKAEVNGWVFWKMD